MIGASFIVYTQFIQYLFQELLQQKQQVTNLPLMHLYTTSSFKYKQKYMYLIHLDQIHVIFCLYLRPKEVSMYVRAMVNQDQGGCGYNAALE